MYTDQDLKIMQQWGLTRKIKVTQTRIIEWYIHWGGKVYISYSGGKDSTVLADLSARVCKELGYKLILVFCDTGLEYPEIRQFVFCFPDYIRKIYNIDVELVLLKPDMRFDKVIQKYGWCLPSKDVSKTIYYARKGAKGAIARLKGLNPDGSNSWFNQRYKKWEYLLEAPFLISDRCCLEIKEKIIAKYETETQNKPIIGTMAQESKRRKMSYLDNGCNTFGKIIRSTPLGFWRNQDILMYYFRTGLPYCSIYGDIEIKNGRLITTKQQRTGCMFCAIGSHLDKCKRFTEMSRTHPKQYSYCMYDLGLHKVLDYYIGNNWDIQKKENFSIISGQLTLNF